MVVVLMVVQVDKGLVVDYTVMEEAEETVEDYMEV